MIRAALVLSLFVLVGLGGPTPTPVDTAAAGPSGAVVRLGPDLYANAQYLWKGDPVLIRVCWENPAAAPAERREWVRIAPASTWVRHARVNFTEWDTCTAGEPGVHIRIADVRPAAPGGATINGQTNGITLNLRFDAFGPPGCRSSEELRRRCIQSTAIHEFGHVLGFYHEEERDDYVAPPGLPAEHPCAKQSYQNPAKRLYGAYDQTSVMSYCGQPGGDPTTWKLVLSPGDIAAVQRAYGRRIPGAIVSPGGNCVAAHAASADGAPAFLWACDEAQDDQEWRRGSSSLRLAPDRCLTAKGAPLDGAAPGVLGTCNGHASQRWEMSEVQVRGWGGLCLDLAGGRTEAGTNVQVWSCDALGGANQRWSVVGDEIRYGSSGSSTCLSAAGFKVVIGSCGTILSRFEWRTDGTIRPASAPGLCVDVKGWTDAQYTAGQGLPADGLDVQLFECRQEQMNQRWSITGRIRMVVSTLCLAREGGADRNGIAVRVATCSGSPAQTWDYYPG
jgi:hypothetical protein